MKKRTTLIATVLIVSLISGAAWAWGPGKGQGKRGGNPDCPRYNTQAAAANLTDQQKEALSKLRQQFIDETAQDRAAVFAKRMEVKMLMQTSEPDRDRLLTLVKEMTSLKQSLSIKMIDFKLAAKKIAPELGNRMGPGLGKGCMSGFNQGRGHGRHKFGDQDGLGFDN